MLTFKDFLETFCMAMAAVLILMLVRESILFRQELKEIKARLSQLSTIDELRELLRPHGVVLKRPFLKHDWDKNQRSSKQRPRRYNGWRKKAVKIDAESGNILELRRPFDGLSSLRTDVDYQDMKKQ